MTDPSTVTAAMIVIGDEVLSGRTADVNINAVATACTEHGIALVEARIVADDEDAIVEAVNTLRARVDYVFTSGGIGPTHDDITADSVAKAFGVGLREHPTAIQLLLDHYKDPAQLTPARRRMARVPEGGELIYNAVTKAPGFRVDNVYVMAGVPTIMRSMLKAIFPTLRGGEVVQSCTVRVERGESSVADALAAVQAAHPDVAIGSYPFTENGVFGTHLVARSADLGRLAQVQTALQQLADGA
ncbi:MAG: molybdopterin-binding protein [Pseudomonadota bacterium]